MTLQFAAPMNTYAVSSLRNTPSPNVSLICYLASCILSKMHQQASFDQSSRMHHWQSSSWMQVSLRRERYFSPSCTILRYIWSSLSIDTSFLMKNIPLPARWVINTLSTGERDNYNGFGELIVVIHPLAPKYNRPPVFLGESRLLLCFYRHSPDDHRI